MLHGFDTFRGGRDVEALRKVKRRRDDRGTFGPLGHILGERLVDLDLVEREHRQLAERGISRPEVIERDRNAKIFELPQQRKDIRLPI